LELGDNPVDTVTRILGGYRIHNAEVLFREDCTVDDLIDIVEGNRFDFSHPLLYMMMICTGNT
jgi:ribosome-interacting GTPase 1